MLPQREYHADSQPLNEDAGGPENPGEGDAENTDGSDTDEHGESSPTQRNGEHLETKDNNVKDSDEVLDGAQFSEEDEEEDHSPFRLVRRKGRKTRREEGGSDFSDDPATLNQLYKDTASTGSAHPPATQTPFGPGAAVTQEPSISAGSTATQTINDGHILANAGQNSPNRPSFTTNSSRTNVPMHLPHFKPATGCTNATDFIVRCFVARLRSGITVVKHARSRWSKSHLRTLYILPDGRTLTWRPAILDSHHGYSNSNNTHRRRRPPQLDLLTCSEVRHAWSADPSNPMFTGTPILRQKCEAAFAHKSFALIFEKRTLDITAVTADQCKVLLEGFSALCFRLQLAQLIMNKGDGTATSGVLEESDASKFKKKKGGEGEDDRTTASVTLTNNSTAAVAGAVSVTANQKRGSGSKKGIKKPDNTETLLRSR